jgi:hypothetical protein
LSICQTYASTNLERRSPLQEYQRRNAAAASAVAASARSARQQRVRAGPLQRAAWAASYVALERERHRLVLGALTDVNARLLSEILTFPGLRLNSRSDKYPSLKELTLMA